MLPNFFPSLPGYKDLIAGSLGSLINKFIYKNKVKPPVKVGKYQLVKPVVSRIAANNITMGIYKFKGKKFFVKNWRGEFKDLSYFYLVNELRTLSILSKTDDLHQKVLFPKIADYFLFPRSFSVVMEYIPGKILSEYTVERQAEAIIYSIKRLSNLTGKLNREEKKLFMHNSAFSQIFSLIFVSGLIVVLSPLNTGLVIRNIINCVKHFSFDSGNQPALAHRDLTPDNLMVWKNHIYILDTELLMLTTSGYDFNYLIANPDFARLSTVISRIVHFKVNPFLNSYIKLQLSVSSGGFLKINPEVISDLNRAYV